MIAQHQCYPGGGIEKERSGSSILMRTNDIFKHQMEGRTSVFTRKMQNIEQCNIVKSCFKEEPVSTSENTKVLTGEKLELLNHLTNPFCKHQKERTT
jgi:hypothetical protein